MSPSARRLAPSVSTERFAWQHGQPPPTTAMPEPLFAHPPAGPVEVTPVMRDLPSPTAERIQTIEREAFARGYSQGERAGEKAAAARMEATIQRLASTIHEVASLRPGIMRRADRELVRLALAMAERILHREVTADSERLLTMARHAAERIGDSIVATIHLHPADHATLVARRDPEAGPGLELVADANVPRGGCLVTSGLGTADVSIDAQIRELSRHLLGEDAAGAEESPDGGPGGA